MFVIILAMLEINGKTTVLAVIGNPIEHSLSPKLHNGVIQSINETGVVCNYIYIPLKLDTNCPKEGIEGLKAFGIRGCNVTIPFKETVIPYLDHIDSYAKKIGAVNTLVFKDNQITGFNTDAPGFINSVTDEFPDQSFSQKSVAVLGAGGSSKAICTALLDQNISELHIFNRSLNRAHTLKSQLQSFTDTTIHSHCLTDGAETILENVDILINTTSVGMHPNVAESLINQSSLDYKKHLIIDIIYNPSETKLLKIAKQHGARTMNGLGMLAGQACLAFKLFTGIDTTIDQYKRIATIYG